MKTYQKIGLCIAGIGLGIATLCGGVRSCNNYEIKKPNFTSSSRATGYWNIQNKCEYTRLKDGSEEILIVDGRRIVRYQNLDGDDVVDRIRVDKYFTRDIFGLENILVRLSDYQTNKQKFDNADKILTRERQR